MAATKENPIIFYDVHDGKGSPWTPNPYKTRLSLAYKGLPVRIEYLLLHEVEPKLKELGLSPSSDTFPYYTLPVIVDPSSDPSGKPTYVADSFAIALYLDDKYPAPEYPLICPLGTRGLQHILLNHYQPSIGAVLTPLVYPKAPELVDEQTRDYLRRTRPPELFQRLSEEEETKKWKEIRDMFTSLTKSLDYNGGDTFFLGNQPSFIDFVFGAIFFFIEKADGAYMKEIATWDDGKWGKYWEALKGIERKLIQVD